jgi:L-fuconolactonase
MKIDAHQHFWIFDPVRDAWIDSSMKKIQRDLLPENLWPILKNNGFDGCVTVQSDQSEEENEFHLRNAAQHEMIKGIVGWVDMQAENLDERLAYYSGFEKMKGFRHVLQGEKQRDFMLRPAFLNGIGLLQKYNFTYDILIFKDQLGYAANFAGRFPEQPFVLDHIAKPDIRNGDIEEWKKGIIALAKHENVMCKLSGMITEADWHKWKPADFAPYLDVVTEAFGTNRLMFGSDWPVCCVAGNYEQVVGLVEGYFADFSDNEKKMIFGDNAAKFYNLQ